MPCSLLQALDPRCKKWAEMTDRRVHPPFLSRRKSLSVFSKCFFFFFFKWFRREGSTRSQLPHTRERGAERKKKGQKMSVFHSMYPFPNELFWPLNFPFLLVISRKWLHHYNKSMLSWSEDELCVTLSFLQTHRPRSSGRVVESFVRFYLSRGLRILTITGISKDAGNWILHNCVH